MLAAVPWIAVAVIVYDIAVFGFGGPGLAGAQALMQTELFTVPLMSGARWSLSIGDAIILLALIFLFVELVKAARRRGSSIADQALSTIILIICVIQFLMVEKAATSVFLIITVAALIDVISGFFIALRAPRRATLAHTTPAPASAPHTAPQGSETVTQGSQLGQGSHG